MPVIVFINNDGGGFAEPEEVEEGLTIEQLVVKRMGSDAAIDRYITRVNGNHVEETYVLTNGDQVSVTPTSIEGWAWVPTLREFKKYLVHVGFRLEKKGPGDHERWRDAKGRKLTVNRSDSDRSRVDIACVRSLSRLLGTNFGAALDDVRAFTAG